MKIIIGILNFLLLILFFSSIVYLTFFDVDSAYACMAISVSLSTSISVAIYVLNKIE
jgi:hypothetical protein